ncbi:hypothetical protein L6475_09035 [Prevotella sp. E9-3]|uniref:hypothetical protein n=1 Tax=Prevotella sp. E9-3 TaxID=2913621 RepID=UPI001EDC6128|nr:hypothetical protein [Prevotella sp. E9-3]UKK47367.1 hypothetical protein L6475_09035 [Prevotella sp. E9-3]
MAREQQTIEKVALEVKRLTEQLVAAGRKDLLLKAIGVQLVEELRIEAARGRLSRLVITADYRFILSDYNNTEVELQPVHKAVYLLFLRHPEGIEFKRLRDYKQELMELYAKTARWMDREKIEDSVEKLVDPLDNAINEKCSRIKKVFLDLMDEYRASYYIISGHTQKHIGGRVWYERLKVITLPRELIIIEGK